LWMGCGPPAVGQTRLRAMRLDAPHGLAKLRVADLGTWFPTHSAKSAKGMGTANRLWMDFGERVEV